MSNLNKKFVIFLWKDFDIEKGDPNIFGLFNIRPVLFPIPYSPILRHNYPKFCQGVAKG